MRRLFTAVSILVITLALAACAEPGADVADLSVVTVLPKEVGPGGFLRTIEEDGIASGYFYRADISDCGATVLDSAGAWAGRQQLTESGREVGERTAQVRLSSEGTVGIGFVVRYSLASDRSMARVRIRYEWGVEGSAPTSQELSAMAVPELAEAVVAAAQCEGSD